MNNTRRLTTLSITIALAMVLSYLESLIPVFVAIPGIKVGLANVAVIFTLYKLGDKEAIIISLIRVALISMLFGNAATFLYSIAGAIFSLVLMIILKRFSPLHTVAVSVVGGVAHNLAQICVASLLLRTDVLIYYLPFLLLSGIIAGIVVGVTGAILVERITILRK